MDQWLLAVTSDPAAKGSAKDLEVADAGLVHCHFPLPASFLTICSSERCLSTGETDIPWPGWRCTVYVYIERIYSTSYSTYSGFKLRRNSLRSPF